MANIKLLNLESSSSLSELSHDRCRLGGITGGAIRAANPFFAIGNFSAGRATFTANYVAARRAGFSNRRAFSISLSNPE